MSEIAEAISKLCDTVNDLRDEVSRLEAENADLRSGAYLVSVIEERERLRKALEPFARIAEMEKKARPCTSVLVNIDRCRDAQTALETRT